MSHNDESQYTKFGTKRRPQYTEENEKQQKLSTAVVIWGADASKSTENLTEINHFELWI